MTLLALGVFRTDGFIKSRESLLLSEMRNFLGLSSVSYAIAAQKRDLAESRDAILKVSAPEASNRTQITLRSITKWAIALIAAWLAVPLSYATVCLFILWRKPLWLVNIHRTLTYEKKLAGKIFFWQTISEWMIGRDRVLDAWVLQNKLFFEDWFTRLPLVAQRSHHVWLPSTIRKNVENREIGLHDRGALIEALQEFSAGSQTIVEIVGIGGSGKTSFVCQIAKWILNGQLRLVRSPLAVPIIFTPGSGADLFKWVRSALASITGSHKLTDKFIHNLIQSGRIIIVADGISEADIEERRAFYRPDLVINSLIVTTRVELEELNWGSKISIFLRPIDTGETRIYFLTQYFLARRRVFSDNSYEILIHKLARITQNTDVTVGMLRLLADQAISIVDQSGPEALREIPSTFSQLLKDYVWSLCSHRVRLESSLSKHDVLQGVQTLAKCAMDDSWRPGITTTSELTQSFHESYLWDHKKIDILLKIFADSGIVHRDGLLVRFWIDPAVEYFSAMHVLAINGKNEQRWEVFLSTFESNEDFYQSLGFLTALYDVVNCDIEVDLRTSLIDRIGRLSGRGQPEAKRVIDQLVRDVFNLDRRVRKRVPCKLIEFGEQGKDAIELIITRAQRSGQLQVWVYALQCLKDLGRFASGYENILKQLLFHESSQIRRLAAVTLGSMDIEGNTIPELCMALADVDPSVRASASAAISTVGLGSSEVTEALQSSLSDELPFVHWHVAETLGNLGEMSVVMASLQQNLKDPDASVRNETICALSKVCRRGIEMLDNALRDKDKEVRVKAADTIADVVPPVLISLYNLADDEDYRVRRRARSELNKLLASLIGRKRSLAQLSHDHDFRLRRSAWAVVGSVCRCLAQFEKDRSDKPFSKVRLWRVDYRSLIIRELIFSLGFLTNETNTSVKTNALAVIEGLVPLLVQPIAEATHDSNSRVRKKACLALSDICNAVEQYLSIPNQRDIGRTNKD